MSVDHTHPDMSEVKKVRVEKTLDVPVGEIVPLAKTSRSAVSSSTARESVMVGSDTRGNFSDVRVPVPDPVRVLYSKSSSPKMSVDHSHPDMSEVKKDERSKEIPEDIRRKTNNPKPEGPRSRAETADVEVMANKHHADRTSSSREKTEYESMPIKRSKTSEMKSEIIDDREGGWMQLKALEQRAMQQQLQHKMDALIQLQTEKNLKMKAEERFSRSKPPSSSSTSRLKPTIQESRTITKREDKGFPKEEKSRLSPANVASQSSSTNESTRARNPENKSPVQPTHAGAYLGFMPATNLPANHALSNNYEQAMHAMQGYPPFFMASPFHHLPSGMMMANPALVPGGQLHSAVTARRLDPKRDPTRSTSSSSDRARPRDEDGQENESRSESRDFSLKKEMGNTPRINPPTSPPMDKPKEYDEGKQRRDTSSLHGSQTLPANLAYRRADMSGGVIDPAQFAMMYPGPHGSFQPPYDHPFMSHQRK